jgi:hypothetical protein
MPPQQPHRLLDFLDKILDLRSHAFVLGPNCSAFSVPEVSLQPYGALETSAVTGTMAPTMN